MKVGNVSMTKQCLEDLMLLASFKSTQADCLTQIRRIRDKHADWIAENQDALLGGISLPNGPKCRLEIKRELVFTW